MVYAKGTSVNVDKTRIEIEGLLRKHGADRLANFSESGKAIVVFEAKGRRLRFDLPLPTGTTNRDDQRRRERAYNVEPEIGARVRHTVTNEFGVICRENKSSGHYVQVRFDGQKHRSPCHPTELEYLATPALVAKGPNMTRRPECTKLELAACSDVIGELIACDQHGNGRSNKVWTGHIYGLPLEFPNMREVFAWAKAQGYDVVRR